MVTILVGGVVMAMWVPLSERVGIGTILYAATANRPRSSAYSLSLFLRRWSSEHAVRARLTTNGACSST